MNFLFRTLFKIIPGDYFAKKYPVSIKGIIFINEKIVLLKNERNEWEPPGGKIEPGEMPQDCVLREIKEELNLDASIDRLVDSWMYKVGGKVNVFIVIYLCKPMTIDENNIKLSFEHNEYGLFSVKEIEQLNMPGRYKNTIKSILLNK